MPKVRNKEVADWVADAEYLRETADGDFVELDEKEHDDIAVYVASKNLPEGVTVQHRYLDHMKSKGK